MAEPAHRDHRFPPERRRPCTRVAPHGAERAFLAWMLALMAMGNYASFARSGKSGRRKVRASPALVLCADPQAIRQKPAVAALADDGDLGVKACPSRPRSSVG